MPALLIDNSEARSRPGPVSSHENGRACLAGVAIPFDRLSGIARRELKMSCLLHLLLAWTAVTVLAASGQQAQPPGQPSPEMQRLSKALVGDYHVVETHHARPGIPEWSITGTARYRPGPDGLSVVEEYQSNNPRGPFTAIAVLWWDAELGAFKHFECETGDPCGIVPDTGRWEGDSVVFTREAERNGRKLRLETRYDLGSAPTEAKYTTRVFVDGGAPVTTMTITYARRFGSVLPGALERGSPSGR